MLRLGPVRVAPEPVRVAPAPAPGLTVLGLAPERRKTPKVLEEE